jgi:hypothetical protein
LNGIAEYTGRGSNEDEAMMEAAAAAVMDRYKERMVCRRTKRTMMGDVCEKTNRQIMRDSVSATKRESLQYYSSTQYSE